MSMNFFRICPVILTLSLLLSLTGCATTAAVAPSPEEPAMHTIAEYSDDLPPVPIEDPWEGFNRSMYRFNYNLDRYFLLPVVRGYEFVTPTFVQTGVSNFFNNINTVRDLSNSLFQLKGVKSLKILGRFLTNSTIGLGGLFDPATPLGLPRQTEDFGETLGYWGAPTGPYVVLPALGPNTVRSTIGLAVDKGIYSAVYYAIDPFENVDHGTAYDWGLTGLNLIDIRHRIRFTYYETGHPFEYYLVRYIYTKERELAVMK